MKTIKTFIPVLTALFLASCASSQEAGDIESLISPGSEAEVTTTTELETAEVIPQSSPSSGNNQTKTLTKSSSAITPQQINRRVKHFTVRIDGASNGSGVIIDESDNTYTVLTNWHVVENSGDYTIQTSDGRQHQVDYQQVEQLVGVDLALVKFTSEQNYQIAEIGDSDYLSEGQGVHLAGYPGIKTNNDRIYRFYNLNIVSLLDTPINQGYSVLYEGETISGMSGSPLLDGEGNLVGIHGMYRVDDPVIRKGSSYAIPINTYKELVNVNEENNEPVVINTPQDTGNQKQKHQNLESTYVNETEENPINNQTSVSIEKEETAKKLDPIENTNSRKVDLLNEENKNKIINKQVNHVNGSALQLKMISFADHSIIIDLAITNGHENPIYLNNSKDMLLRDNLGNVYNLATIPQNPRVRISAGQILTGKFVFLGRISPQANSLTLITNDKYGSDTERTNKPRMMINIDDISVN